MGRPFKDKTKKTISLTIDEDVVEAIKKLCREKGLNRSHFTEEFYKRVLNEQKITEHRTSQSFRFTCECGYTAKTRILYKDHVRDNPTHKIVEILGGDDIVREEAARQAAIEAEKNREVAEIKVDDNHSQAESEKQQ